MSKLTEIESNLIGAYIDNEDLFAGCEHLVTTKLFNDKINKLAYKCIKELRHKGTKVDRPLLARELKALNISAANIPKYSTETNYKIQPEKYVIVLFEHNIARYLLPKLTNGAAKLENDNGSPLDVMLDIKSSINDIEMVLNNVSKDRDILDIFDEAFQDLKDIKEGKKQPCPQFGIESLDAITGGARPGVIVIGARPGMGKTTLLICIIIYICILNDMPFIFFSLEEKAIQVVKNMWANMNEINTAAIRDGLLDDDELNKIKLCRDRFKKNFFLDDTPGITWQYVDTKLSKIRKKIDIKIQLTAAIDYLQLMTSVAEETIGKTDEAQMSTRCRGLMNSFKTHYCCGIEISQLSREVEKRTPPRPKMSDLKESGAIEANANQVWLMYRPDYYEKDPRDEKGESLKGKTEIHIAKNRGGRVGFAYADFDMRYAKFKKIENNPF